MFTIGRGGLPGNNDSGGLSSLYVWNAIGLFPVTGQNVILIGSPMVNGAKLTLANGKTLEIKVYDNNDNNIYVEKAILNGKAVNNYSFSVKEMMFGGLLEIYMK